MGVNITKVFVFFFIIVFLVFSPTGVDGKLNNLVFLLLDDVGFGDFSFNSVTPGLSETPRINELARQDVVHRVVPSLRGVYRYVTVSILLHGSEEMDIRVKE